MTKIDIIGTCYTRELFNTTTDYNVNIYLMQQSIFTMFSNPLNVSLKDIVSHDNFNFKNRMLYYEFNKLALKTLREKHSDFIVIDLIDNVRKFFEFNNPNNVRIISTKDSKLTIDHMKSLYEYNNINFMEKDSRDIDELQLLNFMKKFISILLKCYDKNNIILNKVQMQNEYYLNNVKKTILNNYFYDRLDFIQKLEDIFVELLPDCKILYAKYNPVLDINHKFGGPHPVHFEKIYYAYRMNLLSDLILNNGINSKNLDEDYYNIYNNEIAYIKSKKLNNVL